MQVTALLLVVAFMQVSATGLSQNITLSEKNAPLQKIFSEIHKQTGYQFFYEDEILNRAGRVNVVVNNASIEDVLVICFRNLPFTYHIVNKTIVVKARDGNAQRDDDNKTAILPLLNIKGKIVNENGEPLPGISVVVKGTSKGATTDEEGNFTLNNVDEHAILVITSVNIERSEWKVNGKANPVISVKTAANALSDVVVVGYGTQKKSSLTSAVSDIKGETLTQRPVASVAQSLQGLAPGVTIRDIGGAPGKSNTNIRIRGITTLGNNDPLIIVDGIEQNLADINPADIESITILKDAASTAIYGSRAANGVVLATTKRAKTGEPRLNYDGYYAIQKSLYHPEHMGLEDNLRMKNVASQNAGRGLVYTEEQIQEWVNATDRYKYPLPNIWFDYLLKPAPQQNHTLSVSGGTDRLKALLAVNYFDQQGIIPLTYGDKKDIRLNTDFQVSKRIKLSGDFNYRVKEYTSPIDENLVFRYMLHGSNFAVPVYPDGTLGLGSENVSPLVTNLKNGISRFAQNYGFVNLKGEIKLLEGLTFQTQYAGRFQQYYQKDFANAYEIRDYYNPDNVLLNVSVNKLTEQRINSKEYTLNNLLAYTADWKEHSLNALAGYSQISYAAMGLSASRTNFYNNDVQSISQGSAASRDNNGADSTWGLRSYFGRLTYNYAEKYFIEANARYDGSSRFTGKNKYSFFPSFSGAWRLSQESFWAPFSAMVHEFKLRGSWGKSGNQSVPLYSYFETLSASNYNFGGAAAQGISLGTVANTQLTWETTTQTDIGADAEFLNGKLGLTFDYFKKRTDGILLTLPIPATVGLNPPSQNAGVVENKGWELALTHRNNIRGLRYTITGNISDMRNKIISLEGTGPYISGTTGNTLTSRAEGYPIDAYIGFKTLGIFQTQEEVDKYPVFDPGTGPGDLKYADVNGDGKITTEDLVVIGSDIPRYTFGLNMNFQYKNFDLNLFLQGVGKANGIPEGALRQMGNWGAFALDMQKDYWTPENPDAKFPRPIREKNINSQMSDFWLINTAYLKLKNLQIGYTLPGRYAGKLYAKKIRVYVGGANMFTLSKSTKYGLDPEFPSGRINYYPQLSLYSFGLNASF